MADVTNINSHRDYKEMVEKVLWYCTGCNGVTFNLTTDGCVYCTGCRERISDLHTVKDEDDGDT